MERRVILASHGALAEGMLDTMRMILVELPYPAQAFCLEPGASADDFAVEVARQAARQPQTSFTVVADLYGASVFTAFACLEALDNVQVIAGMNAALVLAALTEEDVSEEALVACGRQGIRAASGELARAACQDGENEF